MYEVSDNDNSKLSAPDHPLVIGTSMTGSSLRPVNHQFDMLSRCVLTVEGEVGGSGDGRSCALRLNKCKCEIVIR
jgi:hypothetical protein